ncbi:Transcription factor BOA, partial [Clarias magur]
QDLRVDLGPERASRKSARRPLSLTRFQLHHRHQLLHVHMQSLASSSTSHLMESEELKRRTGNEAVTGMSGIVSLSFFPSSSSPAHQLGLIKPCP